jgi:hypothetical protein
VRTHTKQQQASLILLKKIKLVVFIISFVVELQCSYCGDDQKSKWGSGSLDRDSCFSCLLMQCVLIDCAVIKPCFVRANQLLG